MGSKASLAEFNRFRFGKEDSDGAHSNLCETLKSRISNGFHIARRLELDGLGHLAYQLRCDSKITLPEAIQRTKRPPVNPASFERFLLEYKIGGLSLPENNIHSNPKFRTHNLDPRISEFVHQVTEISSIEPKTLTVYLPILVEDPGRASAWTETAEIRSFAYSCLKLYKSSNSEDHLLQEVYRKGDRVGITPLDWLEKSEVETFASSYLTNISTQIDRKVDPSSWRRYAVSQLFDPPLTNESRSHILGGKAESQFWDWVDVQNDARLQAYLYTLRILKQILGYIHSSASLSKPLHALFQALNTLPPLRLMMSTRLETTKRGEASARPSSQPNPAQSFNAAIRAAQSNPGQKRRGGTVKRMRKI